MPTIANKIRRHRRQLRMDQAAFAEAVGVTQATISRWESNKQIPELHAIVKLADFLGISVEAFLEDKDHNLVTRLPADPIKVVGLVQAGHWVEAIEWPQEEQTEINVPLPSTWPHMHFQAFVVRGNSMNQIYTDGSIVVAVSTITYGLAPEPGERVIVTRRDNAGLYEVTIKEFWVDASGRPWLLPKSTDPYFQSPVNFDDMMGDNVDSVEITGLVVGSFRLENPKRFV